MGWTTPIPTSAVSPTTVRPATGTIPAAVSSWATPRSPHSPISSPHAKCLLAAAAFASTGLRQFQLTLIHLACAVDVLGLAQDHLTRFRSRENLLVAIKLPKAAVLAEFPQRWL